MMNKYLIFFIGAVIFSSFVFVFDPATNNVSIDETGASLLVCTTINAITENVLESTTIAKDSALDFLQEKYNCE
jgi:hypothetical protein